MDQWAKYSQAREPEFGYPDCIKQSVFRAQCQGVERVDT